MQLVAVETEGMNSMKNYWLMVLLLVTYCLASPNEARAQSVNAHSEVGYYEPTNSMYAVVEAYPDYSTELYYCLNVYGPVYKDGSQVAWLYGSNRSTAEGPVYCGGWATAEAFLPYDANAEYTVEGNQEVETLYRTWNESGYEDYYNYYANSLGDPIYYPLWYGFSGAGPPGPIGPRNIWLGTVYSIFGQGVTSGNPDHLKVVDDVTRYGTCGQRVREITYRIVDSHNPSRPAGGVPIKEILSGPEYNSCSGRYLDETNYDAVCHSDYDGHEQSMFTDRLTVGCQNVTNDPNCGFTSDPDRWAWCASLREVTILARVLYNVRFSFIEVNGQTAPWLPPNTAEFHR
jgi:hypothetical protein